MTDVFGSEVHPDQVMLVDLIAEPEPESASNGPSTALIVTLLWLGPLLAILARILLRRRTD